MGGAKGQKATEENTPSLTLLNAVTKLSLGVGLNKPSPSAGFKTMPLN